MRPIANEQIPLGFTIVPFDVKSLFISVPLTEAIRIILNHVYNRKEISTLSAKNKIKKLLILCTKNVHFTLNNESYEIPPRTPFSKCIFGGTRKHIGPQIASRC